VFECVLNISEGRNHDLLETLRATAGISLRDLHADQFHNRAVFTLINDRDALSHDVRELIRASFEGLDLRIHEGVHPRFGVVDVVPFVALGQTNLLARSNYATPRPYGSAKPSPFRRSSTDP